MFDLCSVIYTINKYFLSTSGCHKLSLLHHYYYAFLCMHIMHAQCLIRNLEVHMCTHHVWSTLIRMYVILFLSTNECHELGQHALCIYLAKLSPGM